MGGSDRRNGTCTTVWNSWKNLYMELAEADKDHHTTDNKTLWKDIEFDYRVSDYSPGRQPLALTHQVQVSFREWDLSNLRGGSSISRVAGASSGPSMRKRPHVRAVKSAASSDIEESGLVLRHASIFVKLLTPVCHNPPIFAFV